MRIQEAKLLATPKMSISVMRSVASFQCSNRRNIKSFLYHFEPCTCKNMFTQTLEHLTLFSKDSLRQSLRNE